jgi:hypothetical protein
VRSNRELKLNLSPFAVLLVEPISSILDPMSSRAFKTFNCRLYVKIHLGNHKRADHKGGSLKAVITVDANEAI